MAERAGISRPTLRKVEDGDPAVSLGIYANVLFVLDLHGGMGGVTGAAKDRLERGLEGEGLAERRLGRVDADITRA
jgi:hypothetical protein